jgi:hypothetical protein
MIQTLHFASAGPAPALSCAPLDVAPQPIGNGWEALEIDAVASASVATMMFALTCGYVGPVFANPLTKTTIWLVPEGHVTGRRGLESRSCRPIALADVPEFPPLHRVRPPGVYWLRRSTRIAPLVNPAVLDMVMRLVIHRHFGFMSCTDSRCTGRSR